MQFMIGFTKVGGLKHPALQVAFLVALLAHMEPPDLRCNYLLEAVSCILVHS